MGTGQRAAGGASALRLFWRMLAVAAFSLAFATAAEAKRVPAFFSYGGEHLHVVADLPDTRDFALDGKQIDLCVKYEALDIFFLPIAHWDMGYVAMIEGDTSHYYPLEGGRAEALARQAKISLPPVDDVNLGFWAEWGGKIVLVVAVGLVLLFRTRRPAGAA